MTAKAATTTKTAKPLASQTLFRGLDIVSAVAEGCRTVKEIAEKTGITFSTTHRLASALVQIRYLHFEPRKGYRLTLNVQPTAVTGEDTILFLRTEAQATTYIPLQDGGRTLFAGRLRLGSIR